MATSGDTNGGDAAAAGMPEMWCKVCKKMNLLHNLDGGCHVPVLFTRSEWIKENHCHCLGVVPHAGRLALLREAARRHMAEDPGADKWDLVSYGDWPQNAESRRIYINALRNARNRERKKRDKQLVAQLGSASASAQTHPFKCGTCARRFKDYNEWERHRRRLKHA